MEGRKLSDQETETASKWLAEKVGDIRCPVCAHEEWTLGDLMARLYSRIPSGISYPVVVLICEHCAYTLTFNAMAMGIEPPKPPSGEEADDG